MRPDSVGSFGGHHFRGVRMGSPAGRSGIVATAVLSWWMLLGGPTFGQEDGPESAAPPSLDRPIGQRRFAELRRRPGDSRPAGHACAGARSLSRRPAVEPLPAGGRLRPPPVGGGARPVASMYRPPSSSRAWRPAGFGRRSAGAASSTCWRTLTATSSACGRGGRSTCSPSRGWASRWTASPGRSRRRTWRCSSPCPTSRSRPSRGSSSRRRSPSGPASSSASSTPSTAIARSS